MNDALIQATLIAVVFCGLFGVAATRLTQSGKLLLLVAATPRLVLAGFPNNNPFNSIDGVRFADLAARSASENSLFELLVSSSWFSGNEIWPQFLALSLEVSGSLIAIGFINSLLSSLSIGWLYDQLGKHRWFALYLAVSPAAIAIQASHLREGVLIAAVMVVVRYTSKSSGSAIFALATGVVAATLHPGMIPLAPVVAATWLFRRNGRPDRLSAQAICAIALLTFLLVRFGIGLERLQGAGVDGELLEGRFANASRGRTSYDLPNPFSSTIGALFLPVRLVFFLGGPWIWMAASIVDLVAVLDGLIFLAFGTQVARALFTQKVKLRSLSMAAILTVFGLFIVGTSNFGTAARHRVKLAPLLAAPLILATTERSEDDVIDQLGVTFDVEA